MLLIGCSEDRVLIKQLTNNGTIKKPLMYYEDGLFNGVGYNNHRNGKLCYLYNYTDGRPVKRTFWNSNGEHMYEKCWNKDYIEIDCHTLSVLFDFNGYIRRYPKYIKAGQLRSD